MHCSQNQRLAQVPCGSGLAREGGLSVTASLTEPPLSQASQLPHSAMSINDISGGWQAALFALVRLAFLHLHRRLGATVVVFSGVVGVVKTAVQHECAAQTQAHIELLHEGSPAGE